VLKPPNSQMLITKMPINAMPRSTLRDSIRSFSGLAAEVVEGVELMMLVLRFLRILK
jgi:hypothetical protein